MIVPKYLLLVMRGRRGFGGTAALPAIAIAAVALSGCASAPRAFNLKDGLIAYVGEDFNIRVSDIWGADRELTTDASAADDTEEAVMRRAYGFPVWSPTERRVAFVGVAVDVDGGSSAAIYSAAYDGNIRQSVAFISGFGAFDWSPRGDKIAYIDGRPSPVGALGPLRVIDLGQAKRTVANRDDPDSVLAFFWSPDGRRIVCFEPAFGFGPDGKPSLLLSLLLFDAETGGSRRILQFKPASQFLQRIVPYFDQYQRSSPIWSPDGKNVVINAETDDGRSAVVAVSVDGEWEPWFVGYGSLPFWSRL